MLNFLIALTNLCWGSWGIFDKKALDGSQPRAVLLIQYALALPEFVIVLIILMCSGPHRIVDLPLAVFWSGLGAVTSALAMLAYMGAMSRAEASYVLGITASYPLVMQLLAAIFLGESIVGNRMFGSALIGAGVFLVGRSEIAAEGNKPAHFNHLVLFCIIVATFGWGVHGLFDKKAVG
ncbi:MAG: EamA family transporter, partial [Terriglobales bacterium]